MWLAALLSTLRRTHGLDPRHHTVTCKFSNTAVLCSACRQIERPQQLLNFDNGGYANRELVKYYNLSADAQMTGFHNCIGVR
jgi:hypothetical protein